MKKQSAIIRALVIITLLIVSISLNAATNADPLPSWNEGKAKQAILDFVKTSTDKQNAHYVPEGQRIATFDQDGTLWVEQPMYTQFVFAMDRIISLAPKHPEWKHQEPFKSIIAKDKAAIAKFSKEELGQLIMVTHTGMTVEAFQEKVKDWLKQAKNPRWHRPYTDLIYQPMLEVIQLLRANGYKTYIVTGGGQDFVRAYAKEVYGILPEQVIGSALKIKYGYDKQGKSELLRTPALLLNNNYAGKAEDIYLFIGHQPQAAFGNSTGDQQMLEYTETSKTASLMMLVHHDDDKREYAYGAKSKIGTFSEALMSEAHKRGWQVVSMKNDWKRIFPFDK
jgi:hypothetical protein